MNNEVKLPETQAAALALLVDGMNLDEWSAAGADENAIPALVRKGFVRREGNPIAFEQVSYFKISTTEIMTEDQAAGEALLLFVRKVRRLHPEAFADVWSKLPSGARNALGRAEARADVTRDGWFQGATLARPAWPDEFDQD